MNPTKSQSVFRADIQALRAIAVVAVVINHSKIALPSGFIGVDMFFVISGFLITQHLYKELNNNGIISLRSFYARRIMRILPPAIIILIITLLLSLSFLSPVQLMSNLYDGLWATFSWLNYRLGLNGSNYFGNNQAVSPFQHFWSLCVEEQFYFVWPLVMLAVFRQFGLSNLCKALNWTLLAIIVITLGLSIWTTNNNPSLAYFGLHTRAWQLAIGAWLAINLKYFVNIKNITGQILFWLGTVILGFGLWVINESTAYPSWWALIPTLATVLIIASGSNPTKNPTIQQKIFELPILQYLGNISYSWYLVHWPVMVVMFYNIGESIQPSDKILSIIIGFVLTVIFYHSVEKPIRFNRYFKDNQKRIFALGISLITVCALLFSLAFFYQNRNTETNSRPKLTKTSDLKIKIQESAKLTQLSPQLNSFLPQLGQDKYKGCFSERENTVIEEQMTCTLGDTTSKRTMILIGDSHAWQWTQAWSNIALKHKFKLITFTKSSCAMQDIIPEYSACVSWRNQVFERMRSIKPDIIIASGMTYNESTTENYREYLLKLKSISNKIISMQDTPYPTLNVPECLPKNLNNIANCSFQRSKATFASEARARDIAIVRELGIQTINPFDWFCTETICPPVIDGIFVYFDVNHISTTYADYLTNILDNEIKWSD